MLRVLALLVAASVTAIAYATDHPVVYLLALLGTALSAGAVLAD